MWLRTKLSLFHRVLEYDVYGHEEEEEGETEDDTTNTTTTTTSASDHHHHHHPPPSHFTHALNTQHMNSNVIDNSDELNQSNTTKKDTSLDRSRHHLSKDELSEIMGGVHREAFLHQQNTNHDGGETPSSSPVTSSSSVPSLSSLSVLNEATSDQLMNESTNNTDQTLLHISSSPSLMQLNKDTTTTITTDSSNEATSTTDDQKQKQQQFTSSVSMSSLDSITNHQSSSPRIATSHNHHEHFKPHTHNNNNNNINKNTNNSNNSSSSSSESDIALQENRLPRRTSFDMRSQPSELRAYLQSIKLHGVKDDISNLSEAQSSTTSTITTTTTPPPNQLDFSTWKPQVFHTRGLRILLVRHGESEANVNKHLLTCMSDYTIPLSKNGIRQAHAVGVFIRQYLNHINQVYNEQFSAHYEQEQLLEQEKLAQQQLEEEEKRCKKKQKHKTKLLKNKKKQNNNYSDDDDDDDDESDSSSNDNNDNGDNKDNDRKRKQNQLMKRMRKSLSKKLSASKSSYALNEKNNEGIENENDEDDDVEPFSSILGTHSFSWDDLSELYHMQPTSSSQHSTTNNHSSKTRKDNVNDDVDDDEDGDVNNDNRVTSTITQVTPLPSPPELPPVKKVKVALWTSPYKRARQTAEAILSECRIGQLIDTYRENVLLGEQQFGLFEGVPLDQIREKYSNEMEHFEKMIRFGGRFYARCPLGESRFDVATRVAQTFSQFLYDAQTKGIKDIIVVSHGVTIRAFIMMFMKYTPEWMEVEENPYNCSVRLLQGKHDRKYIYEGFMEEFVKNKKKKEEEKRRKQQQQQQQLHSTTEPERLINDCNNNCNHNQECVHNNDYNCCASEDDDNNHKWN